MKIGIIIVTYNSEKDINRLLESIILQRYANLVVYIVDNDSKDETLKKIQQYHFKLSISVIPFKINNGFAKGNNIGIQKAMDDGCDLVFILNPDMQLEEKCISVLIERIKYDEKIGIIGPIVLLGNNTGAIIQNYGVKVNFRTQKKSTLFHNQTLTSKIPNEMYVDYVTGGAMMIRCTVLKITGLFEEDYFMYNDEIDIAYRVKKAGFKTLCVRDAEVRHFHDFDKLNKTGNNLMYYYVMRNKYIYFKKFHFYFNLSLSLLAEFISFPLVIIWAIRRMGNRNLLIFYYSGLLDGLIGKKGLANKSFDENKKTKEIILTIDYELFLGKETGNVQESIIEPTRKLLSILEKNGYKMTVFWDILHYYKLLELEKSISEIKQDRLLIEKQILDIAREGHDIQLHLHPHWLDAKYVNGKWNFNYERFKLHNLSGENKKEDINTITGCVSISKKLMEDLIRKVNPDYKVTTFRAGGYLIEPFNEIKEALQANEIKIDCSVCPNITNYNGIFSFDFRFYPDEVKYNFELTPKDILKGGSFIEIPIATVKIPLLINLFFTLVRMIKYPHLESDRKGRGVGENSKESRFIVPKRFLSLLHSRVNQLTTDSNYKERFSYIIERIPNYSTMIIHAKLLNKHTLGVLDEYVSTNKIRFISIQDLLS